MLTKILCALTRHAYVLRYHVHEYACAFRDKTCAYLPCACGKRSVQWHDSKKNKDGEHFCSRSMWKVEATCLTCHGSEYIDAANGVMCPECFPPEKE